MKILIACEESQQLTKRFRDKGFDCYSCDLKPAKINAEWHFQEDVFGVIGRQKFDLMIAHPPMYLFNDHGEQVAERSA